MRRTTRFPSWDGPRSAGETINASLPVGGERLISATLDLGAGTGSKVFADFIDEFKMLVDGREVISLYGSQYAYVTEYNGSIYHKRLNTNKYEFKQHFAEPWRRDAVSEDAMAWGTGDVGTVTMRMKLLGSLPETLLLTGVLETDGVVDGSGRPPGIGIIKRISQSTIPLSAGPNTFVPAMRNWPLHRIHIFSDKVDSVEVWWRGSSIYYSTKAKAMTDQSTLGLNPASTVFTIPFDRTQRVQDFLDITQKGEFKLDIQGASGAASCAIVYEGLGKPTD